jgi:hypothetical protein
VSGSITLQIAPLGVECDEPLISVIARKDDYAILIAEQIVDQNKVPFITNPQAYRIVAAADASNREKTIYPDDTVEVCPEPEPVPVPHS